MELYRKVRLACRDGMSERAAARHFGISRESVRKMLEIYVFSSSSTWISYKILIDNKLDRPYELLHVPR